MPITRNRSMFTLTELLTSIAILLVLLSLVIPQLTRALDSSRGIACVSQLKHIALALSQYREEHREYFPPMYTIRPDLGNYWTAFPFLLVPYIGSHQMQSGGKIVSEPSLDTANGEYHLFYCPAETLMDLSDHPGPLKDHAWYSGVWWDTCISTYNMTSALGYDPLTKEDFYRMKRELKHPSETLVYIDGKNIARIDHGNLNHKARHAGRANMLMGDLHVESRSDQEVVLSLQATNPVFHLYDPPDWRFAR